MKIGRPCKSCPFSRVAVKGHTTNIKARRGTPEAVQGILAHLGKLTPQPCHLARTFKPCRGARKYFENLNAANLHVGIFNSEQEFKSHHIFKLPGQVSEFTSLSDFHDEESE